MVLDENNNLFHIKLLCYEKRPPSMTSDDYHRLMVLSLKEMRRW